MDLTPKQIEAMFAAVDCCNLADIKQVIRCKDCIYRHSSEFCECREPNFYCADGERMDGDKR